MLCQLRVQRCKETCTLTSVSHLRAVSRPYPLSPTASQLALEKRQGLRQAFP